MREHLLWREREVEHPEVVVQPVAQEDAAGVRKPSEAEIHRPQVVEVVP